MLTLRTELTRIQRTNLETCITVHMHQKESTEDLLRKKVGSCRNSATIHAAVWPKPVCFMPLLQCPVGSSSMSPQPHLQMVQFRHAHFNLSLSLYAADQGPY